ncbi:MAG: hypothetical protein FWG00_01505 [Coriobacteriia bacterium]|nr:hypothetical protein [Coriobacteriia bacterium]
MMGTTFLSLSLLLGCVLCFALPHPVFAAEPEQEQAQASETPAEATESTGASESAELVKSARGAEPTEATEPNNASTPNNATAPESSEVTTIEDPPPPLSEGRSLTAADGNLVPLTTVELPAQRIASQLLLLFGLLTLVVIYLVASKMFSRARRKKNNSETRTRHTGRFD